MKTSKEVILAALHSYRGDDLERANIAFQNYSAKELDQEYGSSGQTPSAMLQGYKEDRIDINNAIDWVNTL